LAGSIVLETLAFIVWNIGTRSPLAVARDAVAALRDLRKLVAGSARAVIGFIFVSAAIILTLPALVDPAIDFLPAELFTLLVSLAIEHLIGNDLRAFATPRD